MDRWGPLIGPHTMAYTLIPYPIPGQILDKDKNFQSTTDILKSAGFLVCDVAKFLPP